jgi:two-component system, NtrC family, sensor histidine kinase HydH
LTVRANAPSLVSAVLNLATNALQASEGVLHLELLARRTAEGRAQIAVSDDGPGVPPHLRERIFEPFFTTRARGNGIGLAIVKSVIEAHAGGVSLAETSRGATFIIDLPVEETA